VAPSRSISFFAENDPLANSYTDNNNGWGKYWSITLQWPMKLLLFVFVLFLVWKYDDQQKTFLDY